MPDMQIEVFVRSVGSGDDDWVSQHDLPPDKKKALWARMDADDEAAEAKGFPNYFTLQAALREKAESA
jgi:hypothetical protein